MRKLFQYCAATLFAAICLLPVSGASASSAMPTSGAAKQPVGHYDFCRQYPSRCGVNRAPRQIFRLTAAVWDMIDGINRSANASIVPRTDEDMYGVAEVWSYPKTEGDCEDYVLYKQRALEMAGLPRSALLITVVRQADGSGHAVLTLRTDQGDFILDNLDDAILPWEATDYTYLKRQSETNSGRWVSIEDYRDLLVGSVK